MCFNDSFRLMFNAIGFGFYIALGFYGGREVFTAVKHFFSWLRSRRR